MRTIHVLLVIGIIHMYCCCWMLKALCSVCADLTDMSEEKKEGLGHLCTTLQVYLGEENHDLSPLPHGLDPISLLARVSVLSLSSAAVGRGRALRSHAALWMESASRRAHTVPLGYHPVLTSPAVNPCCYFLSFLLITGNKLFVEPKLSHFLFKVELNFKFQKIVQKDSVQWNH